MIIYKPCGNAKPHPMRDEIKKLYEKYKDELLGATTEFLPGGLKSRVCKYIKLGAWSIPNKPRILADE